MQRRLTAILAADVVEYSKMMGVDETGVLASLKALRSELIDPTIAAHNGRLVKLIGDGALVEFASVVDAVDCALAIQLGVASRNEGVPDHRRLMLRVGINLGDVIVEGDDLYGDGVNVAARLESLAEPGGVLVSEAVMTQAVGKAHAAFEAAGERRLKNIAQPVMTYRAVTRRQGTPPRIVSTDRKAVAITIALAASALVGWLAWSILPTADISDSSWFDDEMALEGPTVAVMPFENLSGDAEDDLLAIGMGEDINVELGRYRDLNVISRQSTHSLAGGAIDLREIGRNLGAEFVLEGTLRRAGERLRVTARLSDAVSGTQVWSGSFDETSSTSDVFDVQMQITRKVASAVGDAGGVIKRIHQAHARAKPPEKLSSYECSLQRVNFINRDEVQRRVSRCIEGVVADEPDYWRGWAQLAEALVTDIKFFTGLYRGKQSEKLERALDAARKAVSLNPDSPRAHYVLAITLQLAGNREAFLAAAEKALALGGDRYLEGQIGYEFVWSGAIEPGAALLRRSIELEPSSADPNWYQALAEYHFIRGEYDQALREYLKGAQPHLWWAVAIEVAILAKLGRTEEAIAARDRLYGLRPGVEIADIIWIYRRFMRPDIHLVPFVEAYRSVGIPEGRYRPPAMDDSAAGAGEG